MKNEHWINKEAGIVYIVVTNKREKATAIIDLEDLDKLGDNFTYFINPKGYVFRMTSRTLGKRKASYLHREVMGNPEGLMIDHINGDKLDNRKENLRIVTNAQNSQNRINPYRNAKSKYRGVIWNERDKRWIARVKLNGKQHYLGQYKTEEEAYDKASAFRKEHMPFSMEDK